nr:hypothetical protein [Conexibacter sp. DBS9H8]
MHATVRATKKTQLALDMTARGTQVEVPPAFDPPVMDLQVIAGLATGPAHPPATAQSDGHDHPDRRERHVDHRGSGQSQQAVECRADAHVALLLRVMASLGPSAMVDFKHPQACRERRRVATTNCATSNPAAAERSRCSEQDQRRQVTHNSTEDPVVLTANLSEFGAEHLGIADAIDVRPFGFDVGEQALDPGLVGRGAGPAEVLSDRAHRHELPRRA